MNTQCAVVDLETWRDYFKILPIAELEKNTGQKFTKEERDGAIKALEIIMKQEEEEDDLS